MARKESSLNPDQKVQKIMYVTVVWKITKGSTTFPSLPPSQLPTLTTSHPHNLPSSQPPILTTSHPHNFPPSQPLILTTSHPHNLPSSQPPTLTTSHPHNLPSSQPPILTTSHPHNLPLSQPPTLPSCSERPTLLEYISYTFNFHSFLAGPSITIQEHRQFMDGSNFKTLKKTDTSAKVN